MNQVMILLFGLFWTSFHAHAAGETTYTVGTVGNFVFQNLSGGVWGSGRASIYVHDQYSINTVYSLVSTSDLVGMIGLMKQQVQFISPTTDPDESAKQAGRAACISSPSSCGIAIPNDRIALNAGWNLVGNVASDTLRVSSVFNNADNIVSVWKWNPSFNRWFFYSPSMSDGGAAYALSRGYEALTQINSGEGFWINAKTASAITLKNP